MVDVGSLWSAFVANPATQLFLRTAALGLTLLFLATVVWAVRDALARVGDARLAVPLGALVAVPVIGVLLYLLLRPGTTVAEREEAALARRALLAEIVVCPCCDGAVDRQWRFCPSCRAVLTGSCPGCAGAVRSGWLVCPQCATELGQREWTLERGPVQPAPQTA